ncbi:MAG: glucose-6-phosphate dehydrogenase assembly protein OpcA [Candidatus Solibacter usitatus]|nr:glucose-6-phosphate dehydrogenase assembly protein OpcA [Candidatus Solibacter usitatus]
MSAIVTPERILKDLQQLWADLGKADEYGVLRACSMTVVVAADEEEDAAGLEETLARVMQRHPSRAIVLRVRDGGDVYFESGVKAVCWPIGNRKQICIEEIEIRCSDASLPDAPRMVLALTVPDLPVVLVCRSPRWLMVPSFAPMTALAGRVIVDSRRAENTLAILRQIARSGSVHDLAWTSITPWRKHAAAAFDDAENLRCLSTLNTVTIAHGGDKPGPAALYLAAWLAAPTAAQVRFRGGAGCDLQSVMLEGPGFQLEFTLQPPSGLCVVRNGLAKKEAFVLSSDWELLDEELAMPGRDRVFAEVLPKAIALAEG